ncbi:MAG: hypothetical protein K1X56_02355 [Flavobacteriales bacterium]|nr:hypothetical protein [Flavobacteriales bacterium]
MKLKTAFFLAIVVIFVLVSLDADAQCAMCKAVAETGSDGQDQANIGEQLNIGVLLLMAVPYVFILIIPLIFFRKQIKNFIREFRGIHKG